MRDYSWPQGGIRGSRLIYGCMNIGGSWDATPLDDATRTRAFAALDAAVEAGYTIFDHADIYTAGKSETVFGEWLQERPGMRERIVLQSKCGIRLGDPVIYDLSAAHVRASVEASLQRLQVDYLDLLLVHRPDPLVEPDELAAAIDELVGRGLVRAVGVSNHSASQIRLLQSRVSHPIVANQMQVSLAHPDLLVAGTAINQRSPDHPLRAADTLEYCREQGITLQAWSPLARGAFSRGGDDAASRLVRELAGRYEVPPEAVVVAWVVRHPAPILPVIGSSNPDRIAAAAASDRVSLSREEWYALLAAARGVQMP